MIRRLPSSNASGRPLRRSWLEPWPDGGLRTFSRHDSPLPWVIFSPFVLTGMAGDADSQRAAARFFAYVCKGVAPTLQPLRSGHVRGMKLWLV